VVALGSSSDRVFFPEGFMTGTSAAALQTSFASSDAQLRAAEAELCAAYVALSESTPLEALKLGTEEEGMDFGQIRYLRSILPEAAPIYVKIGGPCAKADIRQAYEVGAVGLVAPMVESVYGLQRFIEASEPAAGGKIVRAFNMETITAYESLGELLASPWAAKLDFMNIGRSDLAASLGESVTSDRTLDVVCDAIIQARAVGLPVHVGGTVTLGTLLPVIERTEFEGFHTRWLAFSVGGTAVTEEFVRAGLSFEVMMLQMLAARFPHIAADHIDRAAITAARLSA
jgi:hypothetical protein